MIALSKFLDPADYAELVEELRLVDQHFTKDREQHPQRRFEYALALRALLEWDRQTALPRSVFYDVGGDGSPFARMLPYPVTTIIDPAREGSSTLDRFVQQSPRLADAVFCLSVLEHVDDLDQFLYHLACLVAPGGLLFLTYDACGVDDRVFPEDTYHFHWMRKRIFGQYALYWLDAQLKPYGFEPFGRTDLTYPGPHVYDYSFASACFRRRL